VQENDMMFYNKLVNGFDRTPRLTLAILLCLHTVVCSVSLVYAAEQITYQKVILAYDAHLLGAILSVTLFSLVAIFFMFSRFSFGYFLGFYFYTMILGYVWLLNFSGYHYDHSLALISIVLSALAFLAPALLIVSPIRQTFILTAAGLDVVLSLILILAAITDAAGAFYHFELVSVSDIYSFRQQIVLPGFLKYATGITSNALLPFAFACFMARGALWRAGAALLLLVLLYPILLTKLTLFAPIWLVFLVLLSRFFRARTSVVLSLLLPLSFGVALVLLLKFGMMPFGLMWAYFGTINIRMVAIPSIALDVYNDFFSTHSLTYFCQVSLLKPFIPCPYTEPLDAMMLETYQLGSFNASLFATEGIASVGRWAPLSAFVCGLVIALGNRLSSGLSPAFILISGGVLPQVFLNVPLTTMLLSNGTAVLFLLWYVTPRSTFGHEQAPT
jgi:hypothetical protein